MLVWLSEPFKLNMDKITYLGIEIAKKYKYEANVQLCRTRLRPKFRPELWRRSFIVCV